VSTSPSNQPLLQRMLLAKVQAVKVDLGLVAWDAQAHVPTPRHAQPEEGPVQGGKTT